MTPKEKEEQQREWTMRNVHVLEVQGRAQAIVKKRVEVGDPKADMLLLTELMMDLIKRFD
jgi:hypothetical protein